MSLDFDVSRVANYQHVTTSPNTRGNKPPEPQKWHPVTDALVWLSMVCGYNNITRDNYVRIAHRIGQYQQVFGAYLSERDWPAIYITAEDVKMHIGLYTNATSYTDKQWHAHLIKMMDRDINRITSGRANTMRGPIGDIAGADHLSAYEISERIHATVQG